MKWNRIICIVLSLAAVFSLLLIRDSAAWLDTVTGTPPNSEIRVDKMAFSFDGTLGSYLQYTSGANQGDRYVVTEQNLIVTNGGKITVTNHSTIATEARFKITYDTPSETGRVFRNVKTGNNPDSLAVTLDDHWIQKDSDGYFYYYRALPVTEGETPSAGSEGFAALAASATPSAVDAITQIKYLDSLYATTTVVDPVSGEESQVETGSDLLQHADYFPASGNPFSGNVHVIFEAKQADSVNWQQITTWATA